MRWPIRNQILLPILGLTIFSLISVTVVYTVLAVERERSRIKTQIKNVVKTVTQIRFPLKANVLSQMKGLSGADFIVERIQQSAQPAQSVVASTIELDDTGLPQGVSGKAKELDFLNKVQIGSQKYFHEATLFRSNESEQEQLLHIFFPETSYNEAWRQAVFPPLILGAIATLLMTLFSIWIVSRLTQPIRTLQSQVDQIAEGDFSRIEFGNQNDEIADLSKAVNQMAARLELYQEQVRRSEQLRTIGQLGGGIAHQIRNSVTGCRLALELHRRKCENSDDEGIEIAMRQLASIEDYLKRFLALGRTENFVIEKVDLRKVAQGVLQLIEPSAKHVGVVLESHSPDEPIVIDGNSDSISQMLTNLLLNAIEAASASDFKNVSDSKSASAAQLNRNSKIVRLSLGFSKNGETSRAENSSIEPAAKIQVHDSGVGPSESVRENLFDALISDKADGVGLGLSVVRDSVKKHQGQVRWFRENEMTCFEVLLPLVNLPADNPANFKH